MNEDLSQKINSFLSDPDALKMISSLTGSGDAFASQPTSDTSDTSGDDLALKIQNALNSRNISNDRRINLLYALKPYMRETRASNIDKAVKIIRLAQLGSLFKDL